MSQARRQRREMYKRFGILGDKSPQAKQLKNYLSNLTQNISFEENLEVVDDSDNESVDVIVDEMLEDVIEDAEVIEDNTESEEIKETEEDGTKQEG